MAIQYRLLDLMGINLWVSRRDPDPLLQSQAPLFGAGCLVLLPERLPQEANEPRKILSGMLKVLALEPKEICVAWVKELAALNQPQLIVAEIVKWAPVSILVLGTSLANSLLGLEKNMHVTFHPNELINHPENKRKAYQDLLQLKEWLQQERAA